MDIVFLIAVGPIIVFAIGMAWIFYNEISKGQTMSLIQLRREVKIFAFAGFISLILSVFLFLYANLRMDSLDSNHHEFVIETRKELDQDFELQISRINTSLGRIMPACISGRPSRE